MKSEILNRIIVSIYKDQTILLVTGEVIQLLWGMKYSITNIERANSVMSY